MKKIILLLLIVSACSQKPFNPEQENKDLQAWVGLGYSELLKEMGTPTESAKIEGGIILCYYDRKIHLEAVNVKAPNSDVIISQVPERNAIYRITFTIMDGKIATADGATFEIK